MAGAAAPGSRRGTARWRQANGLGTGPAVALAPGSVGASKRWTYYPRSRAASGRTRPGCLGDRRPRREGAGAGDRGRRRPRVRDLTGTDLRNGVLAMAAASVAISNDSGLMHIAAAIGTPTMGIFGPTSPYLWAPLNGLAATVLDQDRVPCQPCQRTGLHHERSSLHARHRPLLRRARSRSAAESLSRAYDRPPRSRSLPPRG